ncbi:MAG: cell wall-active antibiotics response protein LiaF [Bacteroidota bacterium]|jgi:predicted membrane protein
MRYSFWGLILVIFGVLLLLNNLGIADFGDVMRDYWPVLIILWGIFILTKRRREHPLPTAEQSPPVAGQPPPAAGQPSPSPQFEGELVHDSNVFGDVFVNVSSQNFKGGSVSTIFGDCTVNLSQAAFADGEHILRIHGVFGDSTVILPKDAAVSVNANSTFGNVTVFDQHKGGISADLHTATAPYEASSKRLKISITKVFGDVRVH